MNIRFLIVWLALGLAVGGCARPYEITVRTDFEPSAEFSAFHTFAFSGMTDRGQKTEGADEFALEDAVKRWSANSSSPKGSGKSARKTVPTCWYICYSV